MSGADATTIALDVAPDAPDAPPLRREGVVMLVLGGLMTVSPFAIDLYLPALPNVAADLGTSPARASWSLSSYFIGMAAGQLAYGPLLDRFGRKRPIAIGLALFIVASLACTRAPTVEALIALRFVQALGGCAAQVGAMALVRDLFPAERTARVFSLLMLILGVSPLLAPTIGGFIAAALGWRWVFHLVAALVTAIVVAMAALMPAGRAPDPGVRLGPAAIARGFADVLREARFRGPAFASSAAFAALFVFLAGSPVIFMQQFGLSARTFGMIFAVMAGGFIGGNQLNLLLLRRWPSARIFAAALVAQLAVAAVFLAGAVGGVLGPVAVTALFCATLACLGVANPNAAALALAPFTANAGRAAALLGFLQIGVAALVSTGVGALDPRGLVPIVGLLACAPAAAVALLVGHRGATRTG